MTSDATTLHITGPNVRADVLAREAARLALILSRVGRRLKNFIGKLDDAAAALDEDTRETAKWYSATMLGLLREQRERGKLALLSGAPALSEAEHAEALDAFKRETMLSMSDEELAKLAAERIAAKAGG